MDKEYTAIRVRVELRKRLKKVATLKDMSMIEYINYVVTKEEELLGLVNGKLDS